MNNMYEQGFIDKCAELGVNPEQLVKAAQLAKLVGKSVPELQALIRASKPAPHGMFSTGTLTDTVIPTMGAVARNKGYTLDDLIQSIIAGRAGNVKRHGGKLGGPRLYRVGSGAPVGEGPGFTPSTGGASLAYSTASRDVTEEAMTAALARALEGLRISGKV